MAIESIGGNIVMEPGPFDVHGHPRALDARTDDNLEILNAKSEGKAGLAEYTAVALRSGITGIGMMPNEAVRLYDRSSGLTVVEQLPIATRDRLIMIQAMISHEAYVPVASIFGLDPEKSIQQEGGVSVVNAEYLQETFEHVQNECIGLKIYGAITTGGNNVDIRHIPEVAALWYKAAPEKPVIMHLEDENVDAVLEDISRQTNGYKIAIHIAHVSSQQELSAVIRAKKRGMNVTCEVTPHHLSLTETDAQALGSHGCMKPRLKTAEDIAFIWENIEWVDIFASDCAPHRLSDKMDTSATTYGVVNHNVMVPILLAAVQDGKLSLEQLDEKLCINPRKRFNLPITDGSRAVFDTEPTDIGRLQRRTEARYHSNPWERITRTQKMVGNLLKIHAGESYLELKDDALTGSLKSSYLHRIIPERS